MIVVNLVSTKVAAELELWFNKQASAKPGNTTRRGRRLSTLGLLIKVARLIKKGKNIFNIKSSWSELVGTRRSTVLKLPL
jgi:hypothetical protein